MYVEKITNDIKNNSEHKGKSPEKIKGLIIEQIKQKFDGDLKKLAKITGGGLERHTDRKLLYGIAEKLYPKYDEQLSKAAKSTEKSPEQSSETAVPNKSSSTMKSSETVKGTDDEKHFGITNPNDFPYDEGTMSPTKSMGLLQAVKERAEGLEGAFNFKDVSPGEQIQSPFTSAIINIKGEEKSR